VQRIASGGNAWKLILKGGQGPAWTEEPVGKKMKMMMMRRRRRRMKKNKKKKSSGKTP
jgi:hypothetical protein